MVNAILNSFTIFARPKAAPDSSGFVLEMWGVLVVMVTGEKQN